MTRLPATTRQRALRDTCLTVLASQSRLDDTPYYHLCELARYHLGFHVCWCGCGFTSNGVIGKVHEAENVAE